MVFVGSVIEKIFVASDKKALKLETKDGDLIIRIWGECCSDAWIEHLEIPKRLPAVITGWREGTDGHSVITDEGALYIDLRNDSTYYGGGITWPEEEEAEFVPGEFGQNLSNNDWVEVWEEF